MTYIKTIKQIIIIINLLAVFITASVIMFTSNLTILLFSNMEVLSSNIFLLIILLFFIVMAFWPLTQNNKFNIISLIVLVFQTIFLFFFIINIYHWFGTTLEANDIIKQLQECIPMIKQGVIFKQQLLENYKKLSKLTTLKSKI